MNKNIFKYFFIILITLFTLPILIDYLGLYKLAVFTNKIFTSESKKSNKVSPPYQLIDSHKPTQKDSEEEIIPVLEQFPNLKLFDKFLTESDTFLNRCLGDEKKSCHDNLLQVIFE